MAEIVLSAILALVAWGQLMALTRDLLYCWASIAITQVHRVYWGKIRDRFDAAVVGPT
jgi:hypothetical protein